jgi:tetratricopeptide (TPR) repeat protein
MMRRKSLYLLLAMVLFSGCGVQLSNDVQSGRSALNAGNPELAITYFQRTAESQPDYVVDTPPLRQGIWTYLGRAYYDTGKLSEAGEALSRALKRDGGDFMARLYLGMVMLRRAGPTPKADNSLALNDILYALRERVSLRRIAGLVKDRGANFELNVEADKELRRAGADDELMAQIRNSTRSRSKADMPAQEALKEVDRALREIQNWQVGVKNSDYGPTWDPRKRISSKVEMSLKMISTKITDRQELIRGLELIDKTIEEEVGLARRK